MRNSTHVVFSRQVVVKFHPNMFVVALRLHYAVAQDLLALGFMGPFALSASVAIPSVVAEVYTGHTPVGRPGGFSMFALGLDPVRTFAMRCSASSS